MNVQFTYLFYSLLPKLLGMDIEEWFVDNKDNFCTSIGGSCKHNSNTCNGYTS